MWFLTNSESIGSNLRFKTVQFCYLSTGKEENPKLRHPEFTLSRYIHIVSEFFCRYTISEPFYSVNPLSLSPHLHYLNCTSLRLRDFGRSV